MKLTRPLRIAVLLSLVLAAIAPFDGVARAQTGVEFMSTALWTYNQDCLAMGDTLAVALRYGVQLWDVADAADPQLLGSLYADGARLWALDGLDSLLVSSNHLGDMTVMSIADPAAPVELASIGGLGASADLLLRAESDGLMAYSAGRTTFGFRVHNLDTPESPALLGTLNLSGLSSVAGAGDTLLVLGIGAGLHSVDVSDPANPVLLNTLPLTGTHGKISVSGGLAAVASDEAGFHLLDVSDPALPVLLNTVSPTVNVDYMNLHVEELILATDSTLFAVAETAGPLRYDVSDPLNPVLTGYEPELNGFPPLAFNGFRGACLAGDRLYASHFSIDRPGALIFDVAGTDPLYINRTTGFDYVRGAAASGDRVYACTGAMGLQALDHSNPDSLTHLGAIELVNTWGADARGDTAFVASTDDGLVIVDFTDPALPQIIGSVDMGQARDVKLMNGHAFVTAYTQGLHAVDVSDPTTPTLMDSEVLPGMQSLRLDVQGNRAATADRDGGLNLWDVNDPSNLLHLGNYLPTNRVVDVALNGDLAYVVVESEGIHVLDITDPALPSYLNLFEQDATGCVLQGGNLMVSAGAFGLMVYGLTDPANPELLFNHDTTDQAMALTVELDRVYLADNSGLTAIRVVDATDADEIPATPTFALTNHPNPFNPTTTIRFALPAAGHYTLTVYDAGGRRLERIHAGRLNAGGHDFTWRAESLPSGVYFARLAGNGLGAVRKLVLIR